MRETPHDDVPDMGKWIAVDAIERDASDMQESRNALDNADLEEVDATDLEDESDTSLILDYIPPTSSRRLRRKPTRGELIVIVLMIVLLTIVCVYGLPLIGDLLETIQFNDESSRLFLPLFTA